MANELPPDGGGMQVWYAGHPDGSVTVIAGESETPLPHLVKHSRDGFGWSYTGSAPAELARCLLIHALGPRSRCVYCEGTGKVVFAPDDDGAYRNDLEMSIEDARGRWPDGEWEEWVVKCMRCEDGCAVVPAMYQRFKFDVIARLPGHGGTLMPWTMPQAEILDWHRRYVVQAVP